ncbi:MAG: signal peptidase II [Planctomycetota bacterium]
MKRNKALTLYAILFVAILAVDLWSKAVVFDMLEVEVLHPEGRAPVVGYQQRKPIFESWLSLEATLNPGGFSGWFAGNMWFLIPVSSLAVIGTALFVGAPKQTRPIVVVCLGLIAGGAAGNLYDRATEGAVRDFIAVYYGDWVWPNFNIADSALCVGFALLVLSEFFGPKEKPDATADATKPGGEASPPKPT